MLPSRICTRCGTTVPVSAPQNLCLRCLFDTAAEQESELLLTHTATSSSSGSAIQTAPPIFGAYELLGELGRGGQGVVYRARHRSLGRVVALKTIAPAYLAGPHAWERFQLEASAASRLDHPNIIPIYEVGERDGFCFYSMKLVEGATFEQLVSDSDSPRHIAAILIKVAWAVHHAHQRGVLHRDLKPSNILLDKEHEPHVSDFGLARQVTEESLLTLTQTPMGTPAYLAPEVATGGMRQATIASDIYGIGAILYYLLTRKPPFCGATVAATLRAVQETEPVPPRVFNPSAPRDLETICLKCLEKDPAKRYLTAQALAEDLERFLRDEPILARPVARVERAWRWCRRKPASATALVLVLLLVLVLGIGSPIAAYRINQARQRALAGERQARTEAAKSKEVARSFEDMLAAAGPSVARGRDATLLVEILDKTAERVLNDLKDEPEVQGDLNSTLASTYRDLDDFQKALVLQQRAVEEYRAAFGQQHWKIALALGRLGFTQRRLNDAFVAMEAASAGLQMARQCGDQKTLAACLYYMARSLDQYRCLPQEEPYLREAVAIEKGLGNDPVTLAEYMCTLACCLADSKINPIEAEQLYRKALDLHRQYLGNDHPNVVSDAYGLAQVLLKENKSEEAKAAATEALDLGRKIFRKDHRYVWLALIHLRDVLAARGEWGEAEAIMRRAVEEAPSSAWLWALLGEFEARRQQWDRAVADFSRASELDPDMRKPLVIALLRIGRTDDYRRVCHDLLQDSVDTRDFVVADGAAKVSMLLPVDGADFERACRLADFTVTAKDSERVMAFFALCKSIADYRRNRFESARDWAYCATSSNDVAPECKSAALFIQAAAYAGLKSLEPAKAALSAGDQLVKENHPDPSDYGEWATEWAITDFLRKEALKQIAANSTSDRTLTK